MKGFCFDSPDPERTFEAGVELGRAIGVEGLVIALIGPLGAGKTLLVKGLAEGLGLDARLVSSPTFVIAQSHPLPEGPEHLHHLDLYRLETEEALESIGLEDMLAPGSVLAVEWADRFPDALGRERLVVELSGPGAGAGGERARPEGATIPRRHLRVSAFGRRAEQVLADWAERLERLGASADDAAEGGTSRGVPPTTTTRALWMLLAACAAFGVGRARAEAFEAPRSRGLSAVVEPGPADFEALETDGLGTLRARRVAAGDAVDRATTGVHGIARLLTGGRIDLATAPPGLLECLPGLGPARATAIDEARRRRPFRSVQELERVPGIGPTLRSRVEPWLEVTGALVGASAAGDASTPSRGSAAGDASTPSRGSAAGDAATPSRGSAAEESATRSRGSAAEEAATPLRGVSRDG
ncbi:MAG: tRNA (adenosine(37)-N6)-threonylcarbamoyltransferase complex ATPase subunit type 1 TsaE [Spirochaetaceae bacterium]|nr:tRNA (adenosine(37)-N6)-threonylcarbamoyltransferase complex ATPase subunit type 1 TsaE [Spirochaetaceae bacterium]